MSDVIEYSTKRESRLVTRSNIKAQELLFEGDKWLAFLRDHINAGLVSSNSSPHIVDPIIAERFDGDFFGYLAAVGYSRIGYWLQLKINGMKHPSEFSSRVKMLTLVNDSLLEGWYSRFYEVEMKHLQVEKENKRI